MQFKASRPLFLDKQLPCRLGETKCNPTNDINAHNKNLSGGNQGYLVLGYGANINFFCCEDASLRLHPTYI
ncbi:hypothetical protein [Nostoc sp. FACHB-190]|uniref:hypothetical protein n=1 Tax=Nostoc sp. FACHB-190 TaxID=2692838 RepID=UPI0016861813|nr:hypothetical protein [Nostoc sp. FACHB-190]